MNLVVFFAGMVAPLFAHVFKPYMHWSATLVITPFIAIIVLILSKFHEVA